MPYRGNISYLIPRDPSIQSWDDRVKFPGPCTRNLMKVEADEFVETMGDKIKVFLRLKPSTSSETAYTILSSTTLQTEAPKESVSYKNVTNGVGKLIHKFTFTSILDQDVTQTKLFKNCAVKSLKKFINGENYLLMAYGTTNAGKTYTMQGNVEEPGIIPRALDFVFKNLDDNIISLCKYQPHQYSEFVVLNEDQFKKNMNDKNFILSLDLTKCQRYPDASHVTFQSTSSSGFSDMYENLTFKEMQSHLTETENMEIDLRYKYAVWISMIEIYNEQVYDLLEIPNDKMTKTKLSFKDDEYGNTFVKNLRYVNVNSGHEAFQILQFGRSNLHFAPTALNHSSSRSHCIFIITLSKFLDYESCQAVVSRFSFCDLAGMERAKKTLNVKDRLVESKAINTSLSILVKCLTTIKENQNNKEKKLIPYRESKLTKLFRDAVTGKEQFSLIVNVTTEPNLFDETLNVLKFSAIAQKIIPQNIFIKPKLIKPLKKSRFSQYVSGSSISSNNIDWDAATIDKTSIAEDPGYEIKDLKNLVEKLKRELSEEKARCEKMEWDIRKELTTKFAEMLEQTRNSSKARFESERELLEEMYEERQERIIKYYEMLMKNKMNNDEGIEHEDKEKRLKEAEGEIEMLYSKISDLTEKIKSLSEEHENVVSECSAVKFAIEEKDHMVLEMRKTIEGKEIEFRRLEEELVESKNKIMNLKTLLDEAAVDYRELEDNYKDLKNENEVLTQFLAEQRDAVIDQNNEISEYQKILSEKSIILEKLEETNEKLSQDLKETSDKVLEPSAISVDNKEVEYLQKQIQQLTEELDKCNAELLALRTEKSALYIEIEEYKNKVVEMQCKIVLQQDSASKNQLTLEQTLCELREELQNTKLNVELAENDKKVLDQKCIELNSEIEILQKEIKRLMGEIDNKKEMEYEKEITQLKQKLDEQIEEMNCREKQTANLIETLQAQIETSDLQTLKMKNLKDEFEQQVSEIPNLREKLRKLESEVESRGEKILLFQEAQLEIILNHEKEVNELKIENQRLLKELLLGKENAICSSPQNNEKFLSPKKINKLLTTELENEENMIEKNSDCNKKIYDENLSQGSSQEESSVEKDIERKENFTPQKLSKIENSTLNQTQGKSTRKKVDLLDETIHPSTIKTTSKRGKKNEKGKKEKDVERESDVGGSLKKKGKCYKKLFTENDFDELPDLNTSPLEEMPRLRPRK